MRIEYKIIKDLASSPVWTVSRCEGLEGSKDEYGFE